MGKKTKIVLPPELPPEIPDDEIELSSGDELFVKSNRDFARFASNLDTRSIDKHVRRVADVEEDELESFYERRSRKKAKEKQEEEKNGLEVERVDALPVKTLDGKLYYKTVPKVLPQAVNGDQDNDDNEAKGQDTGLMKPTKAEKKAKLKKLRKEAKKQPKEMPEEEVQQTPKAAVLAEVEKEITAEEANEAKKYKLAELGTELLTDPEANIKSLKEMLQISKNGDRTIQVLGLKSLLAVFKDIIPGYRIRLPTEKEQEMSISKAVKKMRFYEFTLLTVYKAYLQRLIALEQRAPFQRVAIRCICTLLDAVPHFNFRENLLNAVIKNISSSDEVVRKLCCASIKSLFTNEGKHGGEATVAAVQLIAEHVKVYNCQLHPDSVEVLMSLSFDEDIGRTNLSRTDNKFKSKKGKFKKNKKEENKLPESDRKKSKKELMSKTRDEVDADFKAASFAEDNMERKKRQTEILSAIFQIFFRILKHTLLSISVKSDGSAGESMAHPLLSPCLNGIGKFAHLIDMDFMSDLISYLRKLAGGVNGSPEGTSKVLTLSERLRCCIVTFKVMKNNLDALNVDLQDFFVQLYNIIVEYRPGRDHGEVLAEALKIMLCDDRQHDMQRAAAFIKRLASFALCFGSAESMAALVTVKNLLQKNVKCRYLLENDAGGGSVSGQIAKYQPYASDPNLSGALASVLWELNILTKHYHPAVSTIASSISTMTASQDSQIYHSVLSPQQAFKESSLENEQFKLKIDNGKSNQKRKRGDSNVDKIGSDVEITSLVDEDVVEKKLCEHFNVIHDVDETTRLTRELDHTTLQLQLYKRFKKQKKENIDFKETKTKRKRKDTKAKGMRKVSIFA